MTGQQMKELLARAREAFPGLPVEVDAFGETSLDVDASQLVEVVTWLREKAPFELLADWSAIDWLGHEPDARRFLVGGVLASPSHPERLRVRVWLSSENPRCPSLSEVYPTANVHEREMWDMFGIVFDGHPNLTRILMPDEWVGHPQRKDEPLGGINVTYEHGQAVSAPDFRQRRTTATTGYPGRTS